MGKPGISQNWKIQQDYSVDQRKATLDLAYHRCSQIQQLIIQTKALLKNGRRQNTCLDFLL